MHLTSAFIERSTGGNGTQGMRVGDSLQWHAWYAGAITHCNGMSGMCGMWAYSTKFNVGMLTHGNGMSGMCGMRAYGTKYIMQTTRC